jgi:hypothetical protein
MDVPRRCDSWSTLLTDIPVDPTRLHFPGLVRLRLAVPAGRVSVRTRCVPYRLRGM